jgi:DNA-binding XRE family transcriptional regulator
MVYEFSGRICDSMYLFRGMADEFEEMLSDLKAWAAQAERGDQAELAESIGISRQRLNNWITGRKTPNGQAAFKLKAFLAKWRRKSVKQQT